MLKNANKNMQNMQPKFYCPNCHYSCSRKFSWEQHLSTLKHQMLTNANELHEKYACDHCQTIFKHKSSLSRHKKTCSDHNHSDVSEQKIITMLLKQNTDLMEIIKNGTNNITNTNTNCMNNNKTFNLHFFLNETCKDAMNITEFIESIKIQLQDLEKLGEIGYVEGLSNIISTNLKALDVTERPVHCTDRKRETIYIKDNDKWEKEDDKKSKLRKVIKNIATKNYKLLPEYKEKYPGCQYADSKYSNKYNKLVIETMGGEGENEIEKEDKIIRNITKNIVVEK